MNKSNSKKHSKKHDKVIKSTEHKCNSKTIEKDIEKQSQCEIKNGTNDIDENISQELIAFAKTKLKRDMGITDIMKMVPDENIAKELEEGIYRFSMTYVVTNNYVEELITSIYETKIREILRAFEIYPELYADIENGNIAPRSVAFMKPSQLCPKNWCQLLAKKHLKEEKENNLPTTDMYKCYKCGERKCTISMLQTRSSDEPMTIFIRCCVCYNTWTK